jgi:hypothetical protein
MEDQIKNEGGTPPTPEEAARIAAVEARRIADRDRKRDQRAREKLARESAPGFQKRLRDESEAEATRRQAYDRRQREILIVSELTLPISPDEELAETPGKSYWLDYFLPELEIFIAENQRASAGSWELFYYWLSETDAGRRVLEFYGVPPLAIPDVMLSDHKYYWTLVHQPNGGPIPVFVNLTPEERDAVAALKQVWDAGRKARQGWKP